MFIAVHVHLVAIAWALQRPMSVAIAVWAYTIAGAVLLNLLRSHPLQRFLAGALLAIGLLWIPLWPDLSTPWEVVLQLFMLKVLYGFAVDHEPRAA